MHPWPSAVDAPIHAPLAICSGLTHPCTPGQLQWTHPSMHPWPSAVDSPIHAPLAICSGRTHPCTPGHLQWTHLSMHPWPRRCRPAVDTCRPAVDSPIHAPLATAMQTCSGHVQTCSGLTHPCTPGHGHADLQWTRAAPKPTSGDHVTSSTLPDGRVFVVNDAAAHIYNPDKNTWATVAKLLQRRTPNMRVYESYWRSWFPPVWPSLSWAVLPLAGTPNASASVNVAAPNCCSDANELSANKNDIHVRFV
jgi:hypothetical protein